MTVWTNISIYLIGELGKDMYEIVSDVYIDEFLENLKVILNFY